MEFYIDRNLESTDDSLEYYYEWNTAGKMGALNHPPRLKKITVNLFQDLTVMAVRKVIQSVLKAIK